MKYIFILIGLIAIVTIQRQITMTQQSKPEIHNILAFGDSLTYGFGAPIDKSYPSVLSKMTGIPVYNAGINGETSAEGLNRLPDLLQEKQYDLVILCFGGNDILQKLPMSQLRSNLKQMINMIKESGAQVLLISVPNISLFGLSPLELYEEVSDETGVPLLSGVLSDILNDPSLKSDQIHPNANGYQVLAEEIYKKLKELFTFK